MVEAGLSKKEIEERIKEFRKKFISTQQQLNQINIKNKQQEMLFQKLKAKMDYYGAALKYYRYILEH